MKKVIVILGPTGVGKSSVAIECAKKLNGEIISADSMQIYKGLNIGTAKITEEDKQNIPHHLIDIREFSESYNAFEFVNDCTEKIEEIFKRGNTPIIVGGTNLYISALTRNYDFKNGVKSDEKKFEFCLYALNMSREMLYDRINKRVDKMIQEGLIEEVKKLQKLGLTKESQAGKSIGYKEILETFENLYTMDFAIDKIKQHSRNYAKRQLTWLRAMPELVWIDTTKQNAVQVICENHQNLI